MGEGISEEDFAASKFEVPTAEGKRSAQDLIRKASEVNVGNAAERTVNNRVDEPETDHDGAYIGKDGTIYRGDAAEQQRQSDEAGKIAEVREKIGNADLGK